MTLISIAFIFAVALLAMSLILPISIYAQTTQGFSAKLSGANESPPVKTDAAGTAKFQLSKDGNTLNYQINATNLKGVLSAHLYQKNGTIIADVFNPYSTTTPTGPINGMLSKGNITANDLLGPLTGKFSNFITLLKSGGVYVNIRTQNHETGEIRGQISTK